MVANRYAGFCVNRCYHQNGATLCAHVSVPIIARGTIGNSAKISDREHGLYELTCGLDDLSSARLSWRVFVCNRDQETKPRMRRRAAPQVSEDHDWSPSMTRRTERRARTIRWTSISASARFISDCVPVGRSWWIQAKTAVLMVLASAIIVSVSRERRNVDRWIVIGPSGSMICCTIAYAATTALAWSSVNGLLSPATTQLPGAGSYQ